MSVYGADGVELGSTTGGESCTMVYNPDGTPITGASVVPPSVIATTGCKLSKSAVQSIPNATWTKVTWDTEDMDTDGFHSGSSGDVTIPAGFAADYDIFGCGLWAANGTGVRGMRVTKGGTAITPNIMQAGSLFAGGHGQAMPTFSENAAAAATFALEVYQNSGGALDFGGAGALASNFCVLMRGA